MLKISGEIGTKSARTRRRFLRALERNVRVALERAGVEARVRNRWSRFLVQADDPAAARDALTGVFGIHSLVEVAILRFEGLDDLVERAAELSRERVRDRTFAVRPKRSGVHDFTSRDVAIKLGDALRPDSAGVNLGSPEVEVTLEIAEREAYLHLERTSGPRGLPVGSGHPAVALFSGGFDSPVAAWMTMRRGTALDLVVCDLDGCGGPEVALSVAKQLMGRWAPGLTVKAHLVDLTPVVRALREHVDGRLRQVLLKRAMYRAGTLVVQETGAVALVTGESLGQVSTQTLRNLAVAEEAAGVPVLRPLIGMDKEEIIERARLIGTHDASARVREHCAIATGRVETAARLGEVLTAEGQVDEAFIRAAVASREVVDLGTWSPAPRPSHVVQEVPEGAVVVDVREPEEGPDAGAHMRLPFSRVAEWRRDLDPANEYVFVCTYGVRSEAVARDLSDRGYRALSLAGGIARGGIRAA